MTSSFISSNTPRPTPSLLQRLAWPRWAPCPALTETPLYPCPGSHPELRATDQTSALCLGLFHGQVCGLPGCSSHVLWVGGSEGYSIPKPQPQQGIPDPPSPHSARRQAGREPQGKHPGSWSPPCANFKWPNPGVSGTSEEARAGAEV